MIDLEKLIPSKFKTDGAPWQWGLIIRMWFEHKGCISLDKVAAYLEEWEVYKKERGEFSGEWIVWSRNHRKCKAEPGTCPCPPPPKGPDKPVLKDYTTSEEDGCNLCDALEHPRGGDMCEEFRGGSSILGLPVTEIQDGQPNQTARRLEEKAQAPNLGGPGPPADSIGKEVLRS
jgi:hypothetical protein